MEQSIAVTHIHSVDIGKAREVLDEFIMDHDLLDYEIRDMMFKLVGADVFKYTKMSGHE